MQRGSFAAILLLILCLSTAPVAAHAAGDRLLVFAAASLKNALDGVVAAWQADHDVDIAVSYAGSSTLARQIERGAPAALFVSANQDWMDRLANDNRIARDSRIDLLRNSLVLVAPRASNIELAIAPDFAIVAALGRGYLAMANTDAVPAGIYGREALSALGVWQPLQGHIAQAADVRAALALVARGEAPLGVVYASDAVAEKQVQVVDSFPADSHEPIVYPAAVVGGVADTNAHRFMTFLQSDTAAAIFRRWGFSLARE